MIAFLKGTIVEKQPTRLVLDVHDVGYELFIPLSSYDRLAAKGETCRILVFDYIREDTRLLFGFMSQAERAMFELLIGLNGIGPKLALSALSGLTVREIKAAVVEGDVKRLSSISGVGKKMAERMIVELRDKIGPADALEAVAGRTDEPVADARLRDAVLALIALGYKQDAARKMVLSALKGATSGTLSVEDVIKKSLGG